VCTHTSTSAINADIDAKYEECLVADGLVPTPSPQILTLEELRAARVKFFVSSEKSAAASDDLGRPTSSTLTSSSSSSSNSYSASSTSSSSIDFTADLALELHRLHMASRSCCDKMALALISVGVQTLHSFQGLNADVIEARIRSCSLSFHFSPLQILRIQLYVQNVERSERDNHVVISSDSSANGEPSVYTLLDESGAQDAKAPTVPSHGRPLRACQTHPPHLGKRSKTSVYTLPGHDSSGLQDVLAHPVPSQGRPAKRLAPSPVLSDDDTPLVTKYPCKQVQTMEVDADITFQAADAQSAKEWLLQYFKDSHTDGHPRCVNSRYVCPLAIAARLV
jgi:hypothetical protein